MEKITHKIIILKNDDSVRERVEMILTKAGFYVSCEASHIGALAYLEQEKKHPVFLIIFGFEASQQELKEILEKLKEASPFTQTMMLIPIDEPEKLIHAINRIKIDSCISFSFQDEDLINQVEECLKKFEMLLKKAHLRQVVAQQNQKMYNIAQDFKQKEKRYETLIRDRKKQILNLKYHLKGNVKKESSELGSIVENFIKSKNLPQTCEAYVDEFNDFFDLSKFVFNKTAQNNSVEFHQDADIEDIINQEYTQSVHLDTIAKVAKCFVSIPKITKEENRDKENSPKLYIFFTEDDPLNEYFEIGVTENQIKAYLKIVKTLNNDEKKDIFTVSRVLEYLQKCRVCFGIIPDTEIEFWLKTADVSSKPLAIAVGKTPIPGKPSIIKYHFPFDYSNAGKLNEDGTIDFRNRGDVPIVPEGALLAEKIPGISANSGINISNGAISPEEMVDPDLLAGPGTRISEDGTRIFSTTEGRPYIDIMGAITVTTELHIQGDVNYETGNINFSGNILVTGIVRDSFEVKGESLTATHIEGGKIELTKDLYITDGIVDSDIKAAGSIHAKYVHGSKIEGFCDVIINKEIIDSTINISGMLKIETGTILNSVIVASRGIEAGNIGSHSTDPCTVIFSLNEYVQGLIKTLNTSLKNCDDNIATVEKEIKELECQKLNTAVDEQKNIEIQIEKVREQINNIEQKKNELLDKKIILEDKIKEPQPQAQIIVNKKIFSNTRIKGNKSSIIIKEDRSRCKIQETLKKEKDLSFNEIEVFDL